MTAREAAQDSSRPTAWYTLACVLYADGVGGFNQRKRAQWEVERAARRLQMSWRTFALMRRARARALAKDEAAARVVQHYYKHKLQLGNGGMTLAKVAACGMGSDRMGLDGIGWDRIGWDAGDDPREGGGL